MFVLPSVTAGADIACVETRDGRPSRSFLLFSVGHRGHSVSQVGRHAEPLDLRGLFAHTLGPLGDRAGRVLLDVLPRRSSGPSRARPVLPRTGHSSVPERVAHALPEVLAGKETSAACKFHASHAINCQSRTSTSILLLNLFSKFLEIAV